jgi:ATP-binding cassette, subfamily C, bacterial CydC
MNPAKSPFFLFGFLKRHLPEAAGSILLSTAAILFGIGLIGTSSYLISYAALRPSIAVLEVSIVGVRFFGLTKSLFRYLERLASHSVNFRMLSNLRSWLYRQISDRFPLKTENSTADLLSRAVEDVETLEFFFIRVVNPPLTAILTGLGVSLIFYGFNIRLVSTFLILILGSTVLSLIVSFLLAQATSTGYIQNRSDLHTTIAEYLEGMPDLFVNQVSIRQLILVREAEKAFDRSQLKAVLGTGLMNGFTILLTNLCMGIMLTGGILLMNDGQLDGKLLAACALITLAAFDAIQPLPLAAQQMFLSQQAGQRILDLVATTPDHPSVRGSIQNLPASTPEPPEIQSREVSFSYEGSEAKTLTNISFTLPFGNSMAVVGPSGAGKSTLAKILLGYWPVSSGKISLGNIPIDTIPPEQLRSMIAYSGQGAYFFNTTLRENLRLAKQNAIDQEMIDLLETCRLDSWLKNLPDGLDSLIGERAMRMSEGERRRLDIARALLRDCPILILDEPFAGLDSRTEESLSTSLKTYLKGKSVLWITHRLTGLEAMDQILVMNAGRIVEQGRQKNLLQQEGLFHQMWKDQHRII